MKRILTLILLFSLFLVCCPLGFTQDNQGIDFVDKLFPSWGRSYECITYGNYVYLFTFNGTIHQAAVITFNATIRDRPVCVNEQYFACDAENNGSNQFSWSAEVYLEMLYATTPESAFIFDLSNPANPSLITTIPHDSYIIAMSIDDGSNDICGYYAQSSGRVYVYDLNNPARPYHMTTIELRHRLNDFKVIDDYLLLSSPDGFFCYDIVETEDIEVASQVEGNFREFTVIGSYAYAEKNSNLNWISVLDLSHLHHIYVVDSVNLVEGNIDKHGLTLFDDTYLLCTRNYSSVVLNIADPESPFISGYVVMEEDNSIIDQRPWPAAAIDSRIYCGNDGKDFYVCHWDSPSIISNNRFRQRDDIKSVTVNNGTLVIGGQIRNGSQGYNQSGVIVVDVTDPVDPVINGTFEIPDVGSIWSNGSLTLIESGDTLFACDISDPDYPFIAGRLFLRDYNGDEIAFIDQMAIVPGDLTIKIIDISQPQDMRQISAINLPASRDIWRLIVKDNLLFLITMGRGLFVYDLSDPGQPALVSILNGIITDNIYVDSWYGGGIVGDYLIYPRVMADDRFNWGTSVIDISHPERPIELVSIADIRFGEVSSDSNIAVCTYMERVGGQDVYGVGVFDFSNPNNIVKLAYNNGLRSRPGDLKMVDIEWPYVYVSERYCLSVFDCSGALSVSPSSIILHPSSFALISAYPNPFNSMTTVKYALPRAGKYTITVHDLTGREITRLADGWNTPGNYRAVWDATGIPSGAYMIRLAGDGQNSVRQVDVVK